MQRKALATTYAALVCLYTALFVFLLLDPKFSPAGGLAVAPVIVIGWLATARRLNAALPQNMQQIMFLSVIVHVIGTIVRLGTDIALYARLADAGRYLRVGAVVAEGLRRGDASSLDFSGGTAAMESIVGMVLTVVGPSTLAGYLTFAFLAWIGLYCFVRAALISFPGVDLRGYALMTLFIPTMVFWPSSSGKDAWLVFTLGLATLGIAEFLSRGRMTIWLPIGVLLAAPVRPHVVMMAVIGGAVGLFGRRQQLRLGPLIVGSLAIAIVGVVLASSVREFLGIDSLDLENLTSVADRVRTNTNTGGSAFGGAQVTSVVLFPFVALSVVLRPFPFEAGNALAFGVSLEGLLLVWIFMSRYRAWQHLPAVLKVPYSLACWIYSFEFIIAFSNFSNLGLLARERSQLLPFLFLPFAVAIAKAQDSKSELTMSPPTTAGQVHGIPG